MHAVKNYGSNHRNNMFSVMANSGFGGLTVYRPDGAIVIIPREQLTNHGTVRKAIEREMQDGITREKAQQLAKKGVNLYIKAQRRAE